MQTWLMILGMTLEHAQMDRKRFWLSESELQSFLNKENHSPFQNQVKLGGVRIRIYLGKHVPKLNILLRKDKANLYK